jgi:hypothetical protein
MENQLIAILHATTAITSLAPASRINWGSHPQGLGLPALVLNVIDDADGVTLKGRDGLFQGRVQVDCYATTYSGAKLLSRAVRDTLQAYRGGGFRLIEHVATRDNREGGSNEAERPYRVSLDFNTHWRSA